MNTYFSIGEMAKFHNVSIQALRHYDKVGLLKPSYINDKSGYRYYSFKDFVMLTLIKQCKAMGLSLEEIKEIMVNYTSFDSILDIIYNQKKIIDNKIRELNNVKNNIDFLDNRIREALVEGIDNIFIKHNEERRFIKYMNTKRYTTEFEVVLSKVLAHMEEEYGSFNPEIAFSIPYKNFKEENNLTYNDLMLHLKEYIPYDDKDVIVLPEGQYLTLNFDDDFSHTRKYYEKLIKYIENNNIKVSGDFHEIYIITRVGQDGKEKGLGQIDILIEKEC